MLMFLYIECTIGLKLCSFIMVYFLLQLTCLKVCVHYVVIFVVLSCMFVYVAVIALYAAIRLAIFLLILFCVVCVVDSFCAM